MTYTINHNGETFTRNSKRAYTFVVITETTPAEVADRIALYEANEDSYAADTIRRLGILTEANWGADWDKSAKVAARARKTRPLAKVFVFKVGT